MESNIKYRIYPSLLDKFQSFVDTEKEYEGPFNKNAYTGEYTLTFMEMEEKLKQSLLDSINRVPYRSLAADNGTVFNELVDCLHKGRDTFREDMEFKTFKEHGLIAGKLKREGEEDETFLYDLESVKSAADFYRGSCAQLFVKGILNTSCGDVELYGFIDELKVDKVYDIKTTNMYNFGKFEDHWQRYVYPFCLINSGAVKEVAGFEFSVVKWRSRTEWKLKLLPEDPLYQWINPSSVWYNANNEVVEVFPGDDTSNLVPVFPQFLKPTVQSFDYYQEYYDYDHKEAITKLTYVTESFISFLESNRDKIIDKKIFNELPLKD